MKQKFRLFFMAGIILGLINVDTTVGQSWNITGNGNATSGSILGTTNSIPLRLFTNNAERLRVDASGKVGIGTSNPLNLLTVKLNGSTPASSWLAGGSSLPVFLGFGENQATGFNLATAADAGGFRPVLNTRRSRGTLAVPTSVVNNDYLASFVSSGYDGSTFQNPATIDFYVDGTPSSGNVPGRISFVTGTNASNRLERLKVGSTGNFNFNNSQLFIQQSSGNVGIGTTSPGARLDVKGSTTSGTGGNFTGYDFGLQSGSTSTGGYGIFGYSSNIGVYGTAADGTYGVYGFSGSVGTYGTGPSSGVYGYSNDGNGVFGSSYNGNGTRGFSSKYYGGYFASTDSYGVVASSDNAYYAGVFYGHIYSSGGLVTSDRNLKKDIHEFENAMTIINKLKPRNYEFKDEAKYDFLHLPKGRHYGLIAQDLEQVLPNLVAETPHEINNIEPEAAIKPTADGKPSPLGIAQKKQPRESMNIKAVNYVELIPIMVKAMQEQDAKISRQELRMQEQDAKIDALTQLVNKLSQNTANPSTVKITGAFLGQSIPNPSVKNTSIGYNIPVNSTKAELVISNMAGQKVKQVQLNKSGLVTIDTSVLSAGTYSYTLIIDDKSIDTKKMTIVK